MSHYDDRKKIFNDAPQSDTKPFVREDRYIVFKIKDVGDCFMPSEVRQLNNLFYKTCLYRRWQHKKDLECVVVEADWPEYEPTWAAIEKRITGK